MAQRLSTRTCTHTSTALTLKGFCGALRSKIRMRLFAVATTHKGAVTSMAYTRSGSDTCTACALRQRDLLSELVLCAAT